jgi:hypothetical protein
MRFIPSKLFRKGFQQCRYQNVSKEYAFNVLGLKSFSEDEIRHSFDLIKEGSHSIENAVLQNATASASSSVSDPIVLDLEGGIQSLLRSKNIPNSDENFRTTASNIASLVVGSDGPSKGPIIISFNEYQKNVIKLGEALDSRISNLAISFLLTGSSVGIIIPCLPILVNQLSK